MTDRQLRGVMVTRCGISTTLLTAAGVVYLELRFDCAIYGFVFGFVIPLGAMLSGFVAASGTYLGSRMVSYRPGWGMFATMVGVSGGNFFLVYWLKYSLLRVAGEPVRNWMTYGAYLRIVLAHTPFKMGHTAGDAAALGAGGYGYAALLILGFAFGGYFVFSLVRSAPYCQECGVYMKKQGSQTRYFVRRIDMAACVTDFKYADRMGKARRAVETHARAGVREADAYTGYALRVEFKQCIGCGRQWLELIAEQRVNEAWNRIVEIRYAGYCAEAVEVTEELAGQG